MPSEGTVLGRYEEVRNGVPLKYKIQIMTPDMYDDVTEFMKTHFITRQPVVAHDSIKEEELSVKSYKRFWRIAMEQGESLVALEDREDGQIHLVGVNLLNTNVRNQTFAGEYEGEKFGKFLDLISDLTAKGNTLFDKFGIDKYQRSCGLSVHTDYNGYRIGHRLLTAQDQLCKLFGYKCICTVFTSHIAQSLASKLGYETIAEQKCATFKFNGKSGYPGLDGSVKLMCKVL